MPIPIHFSLLISKMWMFNLATSCLTTSNLPWLMDLTFQVAMQYCSLQHWTLLLPPDISSTECHFLFDPATSFFSGTVSNCLPLFYSSTLNTFKPGSSSSGVMSFCLFIVSMGLYRQNTGVGCHFLLQWTMFCQNSSLCPVFLGWSCMVWLHWVMQGPSPPQGSIPGNGQINGHEFEQTLGNSGQRSLTCCSPRGHKESDVT